MRNKFIFITIVSLLNTVLVTGVTIFDRMNTLITPVQRQQIQPSLFAVAIFVLSFVVITALFLCEPLFTGLKKQAGRDMEKDFV